MFICETSSGGVFSTCSEELDFRGGDGAGCVALMVESLGRICWRLYFVSGNKKIQHIAQRARTPVFNHQKERQPRWAAIGPDIIGPTCKKRVSLSHWDMEIESDHQRAKVEDEV